ncbi:hypothetical protein OV090_40710 [Nannocystis sp. RBIL2]|uniref:hypothetical protein n=1 Tax=Nannocystis sp. RBIL2 TaxID=2996788 RepID=UPI002271E2F9|nr:hypothetical protein [Nannocystis sp. RBIL2]MCY1071135.1 hypothetical protein [Nannocystis sp. RBIL2]
MALAEPAPAPAPAPPAAPTDPTYASYLRARGLLDQALAAHGELTGPLWWRARGTIAIEGHYKKPYEVHSKAWEEVVERRDDAVLRRVKFDDKREGLTICNGERGFFRDTGDPPTDQRSDVVRQCDALARALPQQLLRRVRAHASSLRWLGEGDDGGVVHDVLAYADASGSASLWLRRDDHRLARWERLVAHPQLGDAAESVRYADYREFAGVLLPARRIERWLHEDAADTRDVTLELVERVGHEDLAPAEAEAHWLTLAGTDAPPAPRPPAHVVALSPALFLVELPVEDSRAAFAVFDDFVVVLDAPLRSAAGEDLLAAVRAHAPDKEIRYAVFGHHHPHYSGGLRPLIHAGATIVTTAGNVPLIEDLARRPHALAPDALAREPRAPKFLVVAGKHVFSDASGHALELHDIGAYIEHTDSYLVYYSPRERLLIEGDLAFFPVTGEVPRAWPAALGLARAIDTLGLDVAKIVQTWPLARQVQVAERAKLDAIVAGARP